MKPNIQIYLRVVFLTLLLAGAFIDHAIAQTPNNQTLPPVIGQPVNSIPAAYSGTGKVNYIRTWTASKRITAEADLIFPGRTTQEVKQGTRYFDALGRLIQTVSKGVSPGGKDLVTPSLYDSLGRESIKYLPYAASVNTGTFRLNAFGEQATFMAGQYPGESIYYQRQEFEASPLNRMLKAFSAGNSWAREGGNRPVSNQSTSNTVADSVRDWRLDPSESVIPISANKYLPGALSKSVTMDESGSQVVEYKDNEGHIILKKTQLSPSPGTAHIGWLCTYYVYDDYGNLRIVIPPLAVEKIMGAWVISSNILFELCFQYQYDGRGRMIVKKMPGAGEVHMVYDNGDRLAMTQDSLQRAKSTREWLVSFYDIFDRTVMTAIYPSNQTREQMQAAMELDTGLTLTYTIPGVATPESVAATRVLKGISGYQPLTFTYYDDYTYNNAKTYDDSYATIPQAGNNLYADTIRISGMTKGLMTGSKKWVIGTTQWLGTAYFYDEKKRIIQTSSDNGNGGEDIITTLYDFGGKVLSTFARHKNPRSSVTPQTDILSIFGYDATGRLLTISKRVNSDATKTIVENSYNETGGLTVKRLGVISASTQWEKLNYDYNIRGWLRGINKLFVNTTNSISNWFGEELNYDYGFAVNQFNGDIAGTKWKSRSSGIARAYGYGYDKGNRLILADYSQQNTGSINWTKDVNDFSVTGLAYDANGNIGAMTQKGMVGTFITPVDQLTYRYQDNSNKLLAVNDPSSTTTAKLGDFINGANPGDDYAYNGNGGLTKDLNKNISMITYNYLNLPQTISITGKGTISFLYDAAGNKLRKTVLDQTVTPNKTIVTDYLGDFVYKADTLQFISNEEGRIRTVFNGTNPPKYVYDYFVKDHLGNIRTVLTDEPDLSIYSATMEAGRSATESALFSNLDETRSAKPAGYPEDKTTSKNEFVAKLNAKEDGKKIGPAIVIRVMAGDTVQMGAKAFYKSTVLRDNKSLAPEDMVASLLRVFGGEAALGAAHGVRQVQSITPFSNFTRKDYQRLKEKDPEQNQQDKPRAYLNFALFDDQFNLVEDNSGVRQVKGMPDELHVLAVDKMLIKKTGFLYVYASNETQQDVFFDNIVLGVAQGPLLEETHYYPFGLTMAAISNNVLKGTKYGENRIRYNGKELQSKEFSDGAGLEWYDYGARIQDPQIGRWHAADPMAEKFLYESPYVYGGNNPIMNVDIGGNFKYPKGREGQQYEQSYKTLTRYLKSGNLEQLLQSQTLVNAFAKYGRLNVGQIKEDFKWNSGATLKIVDRPGNAPMFPDARGNTPREQHGDAIEISKKLVDMLESAKPEDQEAALWWVVKVLLHEEVHRGDIKNDGVSISNEPGKGFDEEVWSPYTEDGIAVPYLDWPSFSDPDWKKGFIDRAREVMQDKSKKEDTRKMLPSLVGDGLADTINNWLDGNANINLNVIE